MIGSWIQYQFDTSANVADVLTSDREVRINERTPVHWDLSARMTALVAFHAEGFDGVGGCGSVDDSVNGVLGGR
jgi:hypothetical protein